MIVRRKCVTLLAASLTAFGLVLGGCADSDSGAVIVNADLDEYSIALDKPSARAGKVKFMVNNQGEEVHEFVVLKTDYAPADLPREPDGDADERAAGVIVIDEIEDISPGETAELTLNLDRGNYVIICNLVTEENGMLMHHYPLGMYTGFTVE